MKDRSIPIAIKEVNRNISKITSVKEWANHMGYDCPKEFSKEIKKYYEFRPIEILTIIRLLKINELLNSTEGIIHYEIALRVGLKDEKALCNYVNYHLNCSPSNLKSDCS